MEIDSKIKTYNVFFEQNFMFVDLVLSKPNLFCVIDKKVYYLYLNELFSNYREVDFFLIDAVEENKSIETALSICDKLSELPSKRNTSFVSIGGGIVQDITGFVANIMYRGITWTFLPTTLLAACDSCIGGKTSLNYKSYKNLLGTFYPPDEIFICTHFFKTLDERDYMSGLGEVVKFSIMQGQTGIKNIKDKLELLLLRDYYVLDKFVKSSLSYKKSYIETDEFDKGIRVYLNFAHTFGHAFETTSNFKIPHGTAVALGTIMASYVSYLRLMISKSTMEDIEEIVLRIIPNNNLDRVKKQDVIAAIKKDKKQIDSHLTVVLAVNDNMDLSLFHDLQEVEVEKALKNLFEKIKGREK